MGRIYAENRIRDLRRQRGVTQEQLAEGVGGTTTKATIAKLENRAMALSADYIVGIARVLGVHPGEVIAPLTSQVRELPLLGAVAAGNWREAIHDASRTVQVPEWIPAGSFALSVAGDSMDLIVPDGGIIIVNPDDLDLINNRIYVVANGSHETTFKRFSAAPPRLLPCSTNPAHLPIEIGREPFVAIGRVIHAAFDL